MTHRKGDRLLERLIELATAQERSVNHLLIQAGFTTEEA